MTRYLVIFSLVLINAAYAQGPIWSPPPLEQDPTVYLDAALARAKQFVPKAEFNRVDSVLADYTGFCPRSAWQFTLVDRVAQDLVFVDVKLTDDSKPGGAIHCSTAYNVRIEHDYLGFNVLRETLVDPKSKLGISFDRGLELLQNTVKRPFSVKSVSMEVMGSGDLFIMARVYAVFSDMALSYAIDMTHGLVDPQL